MLLNSCYFWDYIKHLRNIDFDKVHLIILKWVIMEEGFMNIRVLLFCLSTYVFQTLYAASSLPADVMESIFLEGLSEIKKSVGSLGPTLFY
jgi:hypothetical protein